MAEKKGDRAEQREEIKLLLEYLKLAMSLAVIISLVFAGLQWRLASHAANLANQVANENTYSRMTTEWTDHLKTFVEKPTLRPYFESKKSLSSDDPNTQTVLALADMRLNVADTILIYAIERGNSDAILGWKNTFSNAFRSSPVLCVRLNETHANYGLIVPIAQAVCER